MGRAAGAKLHLDLDEPVAHPARVDHRHLVQGHLGGRPVARDELATPPRAQLGDALERTMPQVGSEQLEHRPRRLPRTTLLLELEARALGRELELPDAVAVFGTAPERDACSRERPAGHVVVDGGEDARIERPAAERREPEADRSIELALVLARRPHTGHVTGAGSSADEIG